MSYATVSDMILRFGETELIQLTDPQNNAVVDVSLVDVKLADAKAVIDGWIGSVFRLPLRGCLKPAAVPGDPATYEPPPQLVRLACDIARFYLFTEVAPENVVYLRHKAALAELQAIASGAAVLACPWGGSPGDLVGADAQQGAEVFHSFSPRQITDDTTRGYA